MVFTIRNKESNRKIDLLKFLKHSYKIAKIYRIVVKYNFQIKLLNQTGKRLHKLFLWYFVQK